MSTKRKADTEIEKNGSAKKKAAPKKCAIAKEDFFKHATELKITIEGKEYTAKPKEFSSGSFGWLWSAGPKFTVDGKDLGTVLNCNIIVRNSAPPKEKK